MLFSNFLLLPLNYRRVQASLGGHSQASPLRGFPRGCLLRWKPVEVSSTWERPPLGSPQKFTCPRMSVGYAGVLPIRGQAPAYRTKLLGIRPTPL